MSVTPMSESAYKGRMQRLCLIIAAVVFVADQISKPIVLSAFGADTCVPAFERVAVLPFFNLVLVCNQGVSFGLFSTDWVYAPFILAAMAIAIAMVVWWVFVRGSERLLTVLAGGLVIGGAFGNALDRVLYGAVVDFLDLHVAGYHWPAFNIADCAIVVGAALFVWDALFGRSNTPT